MKRNPGKRPVIRISKNGTSTEYKSAVDAQRKTGFKYQNIRVCCDNHNRTCGGSFWRWK